MFRKQDRNLSKNVSETGATSGPKMCQKLSEPKMCQKRSRNQSQTVEEQKKRNLRQNVSETRASSASKCVSPRSLNPSSLNTHFDTFS